MINKLSQARMNISFCAEFDEALLSAMDKLERDYEAEKERSNNSKASVAPNDFTVQHTKQDIIVTNSISNYTNIASAYPTNTVNSEVPSKKCTSKARTLKVASENPEFPSQLCKQNILAKTPHTKTNGCHDLLENGSVCTWVTPLHVSTPVDALCKNTDCNIGLMQLRSNGCRGKTDVNCVIATPKVVCSKSKSNLEKTKLFQAILNSSADDGIADGQSSNLHSTSAGLAGLRNSTELLNVHCGQVVDNPGASLSPDVDLKLSKLRVFQLVV